MLDLTLLDAFFSGACSINSTPCLTVHDAASAIVGGLVAGISAIWLYVYRKNSEYADNRNDVARIQANEIRRNMETLRPRDRRPSTNVARHTPSINTYMGLLTSGDIKYFDDGLQDLLDQIRFDFDANPLDPDIDLCTSALERLDRIMGSRDRYFTWLPVGWRRLAKRNF